VEAGGTSQLIHALPALARGRGIARAVIPAPSYADYETASRLAGFRVDRLPLAADRGFVPDFEELDPLLARQDPALVFLGLPNNPDGAVFRASGLRQVARRHPECLFAVDEAFADFVPGLDRPAQGAFQAPDNVVCLLSLTKFYAVPGLRVGLAAAAPSLAAGLRGLLPSWPVGSLERAVAVRALGDEDFRTRTLETVPAWGGELRRELAGLPGLETVPGRANYVLCRLAAGLAAPELFRRLLDRFGIAIRDCSTYPGLDETWFRVAVRTPEDNLRLLEGLDHVLAGGRRVAAAGRRSGSAPALMIQGTSSGAGKSVLAAGICRVLLQDGHRVAPFKAQNMSNNSFVTRDGLEMGRAQATQAAACRLDPEAAMNPVLLKPSTDTGSQVIVMGRPVGVMRVGEYVAYKEEAFAAARAAYDSLAGRFDVMVLEGAGSPAEVNLKDHEFVNMRTAAHARARVLLVADIDRGGSFAHLVGTMECLEEAERALVSGYVLNRFRGDASLLAGGFDHLLERTHRPVLGVVPHLPDLDLPEEDSVAFKAGAARALETSSRDADLDLALVDLPHLANLTDFDALALEPDTALRAVRRPQDLGRPDAVIIPGSKNTPGDAAWLLDSGLGRAILDLPASCEIVGICGGLQILGERVTDPLGLESADGDAVGLGLLPLTTELGAGKVLAQARAVHRPTGLAVSGYEIHHGVTRPTAAVSETVVTADGRVLGWGLADRPVWGTYLHGVFDADGFRRAFLDTLRARKGLDGLGDTGVRFSLEPALDRLADILRESLDFGAIYRMLGL
jgi:cobyric acid synthase CobQ